MFKRQKIAFASKPVNRRGIQTDALTDGSGTKAYEGSSDFNTNQAGKATFKVKKSSGGLSPRVGKENVAMFTNNEI